MSQPIAVIAGAGPGVGLAVAQRFMKEGFQIVLLARRAEALAEYVAQLGGTTKAYPLDFANIEAIHATFEQIKAELGDPQVLVYNAAVLGPQKASQLDPIKLAADFQVNVVAALASAQAVTPAMQAKKQGTILFTGGGLALYPSPMYTPLSVCKAGLRNLSFCLAAELEPEGIHVATVTIAGFVGSDTHFAPDLIAEQYWQLHSQQAGQWEKEFIYKS